MIDQLLVDTIYHSAISGVDSDGQFTFSSPVAITAKVDEMDSLSSAGNSQSVSYRAEIITLTEIKREDRLWLPNDSSANTDLAHSPSSVQSATGLGSGQTVYKVIL